MAASAPMPLLPAPTRIANLGLTFTQQGSRTVFDLKSNYATTLR